MASKKSDLYFIRAWQNVTDYESGHGMVQCDVRSVLAVRFEVVYYTNSLMVEIPCPDLGHAQRIIYALSTAHDQGRESMKEDYRNLMGIKQ